MAIHFIHTKGRVSNVNDPQEGGRIRATISEFNGEYPAWISPAVKTGWVWLPEEGDIVDISYPTNEDIDEGYDLATYSGVPTSRNRDVPDEFHINYSRRRGFKTKAGHLLIIDDQPGEEKIILSAPGGTSLLNLDISGKTEIKGDQVVELASLAKVFLNAPFTDLSDVSTDFVIKGTTFAASFTALLASIAAAGATLAAVPVPNSASNAAFNTALVTAFATFAGTSSTWLSTKVKTG